MLEHQIDGVGPRAVADVCWIEIFDTPQPDDVPPLTESVMNAVRASKRPVVLHCQHVGDKDRLGVPHVDVFRHAVAALQRDDVDLRSHLVCIIVQCKYIDAIARFCTNMLLDMWSPDVPFHVVDSDAVALSHTQSASSRLRLRPA